MEKERRTKALLLSTLVVVVATLSIAFAAMSRTLNINGIGKMDTATWDVRFENLREAKIVRDAIEVDEPKITDNGGVVENINVKLTKPKDEISYTVDIANRGTIDAQVNIMTISDLTDEEEKLIDFGVYYLDGAKITKYDLLEPEDVKSIIIKIRYKDDITEFDLPKEPLTIKLSCQIEYVQSDASVVIKPNGDFEYDQNGGYIFDGVESVLAGFDEETGYVFNTDIMSLIFEKYEAQAVESLTFLGTLKVPKEAEDTAWDASENKDGSVVGWFMDSDNDNKVELYIGGNKKVIAPDNCACLFQGVPNLETIYFNGVFDTSNVADMSYMFSDCTSLTSLDLSSFNTSNVEKIYGMFRWCILLESINLSGWDTSKITALGNYENTEEGMFYSCESLVSINFSGWNTSNVTDMSGMFYDCTSLTNLNLSTFDTRNVTNMSVMFSYCTALKSLDLSNFNTSNVTDMSGMFEECTSLITLIFNNASFDNVTSYSNMFKSVPKGIIIYVKDYNAERFMHNRKWDAIIRQGAPTAFNSYSLYDKIYLSI